MEPYGKLGHLLAADRALRVLGLHGSFRNKKCSNVGGPMLLKGTILVPRMVNFSFVRAHQVDFNIHSAGKFEKCPLGCRDPLYRSRQLK